MKKIRDGFRMVCLFIRLVYEMLKNYFLLNDDLQNNFKICKKICKKIVRSAKIELSVQNSEYLLAEKPFLLVSNHRCFFDVVFLLAAVEQPISFVAAKELFSYPVLRKYLASIRCVMLDRYAKDFSKIRDSITDMKTALSERNLVLFPEGECSYYDTRMRKFKKGGFLCVAELDACVVPAYIRINKMHNIGRWMIPEGEVSVCFGRGFYPEELSGKRKQAAELADYAQQKVIQLEKKFANL